MSSNDKFYIEEITGIHSDFYGVDYDNPNPPETEPTPEEQREADIYWESVKCQNLTLGGYKLKQIN